MKLYSHPLSGHSHRVSTFLSIIGVDAEIVTVDLAKGEHKTPEFKTINRLGQVPVLVDGDTVVADSLAILVYLARKYDRTDWLPDTPEGAAAVQRWFSVAAGQLAFGAHAARLITLFGATNYRAEEVIARAHAIIAEIDAELEGRRWILGGDTPTLADLAIYGATAKAPEGNIDISGYRNVTAWLARLESLPGFVAFQSSPVGLLAA